MVPFCGGHVPQLITFENVPTAFKWWARLILTRVTGSVTCMHGLPTRNLPKSSKGFLEPRVQLYMYA